MSYRIILCFLLITPFNLFSQSLIGTWKGQLHQDPNKTFYFEIRIETLAENGYVTGFTYIESYGESLSKKGDFGTIAFDGHFTNNNQNLHFQETKIVKEVKASSNYNWCIASGDLTLKEEGDSLVLKGPWTADGGCSPGTLSVKMAKPVIIQPIVTNPDTILKTDTIVQPVIITSLDTLENRVVETKYNVHVDSTVITLEVWDNNLVDGDIISLNLNGEWILKDYTVEKAKKKMTITILEKQNILILHAENLGSHPPNTAAININDGKTKQKIILNSDKGKSEAITINVD